MTRLDNCSGTDFCGRSNVSGSASPPGGNTTWETAYFYGARSFPGDQTTLIDGSVGGLGETPFSLSNGVLNIHAQETTPLLKAAGVTTPYTGGQIDTHNTFSQQYGYFEMRAQLSGTPGTHTAFWMMPMAGAWPPEIDIQETLGSYPTYLMQTNHYNASNPSEQHQYTTVADTSKGFHTYGLKWTPTTLTFYFDDQETFTTPTQADEHQPMYMLVSEYAGLWAGTPAPGFGADYKIDWVRAYSSARTASRS